MKQNSFLALPLRKKVMIILGTVFFLWIMFGVPTGWIYDLGVGTGTEQGQMPDQSVSTVHTQADVEDFFFQNTPATISQDDLIQCPLMRLRDITYAGEHTRFRRSSVVISEYVAMAYPISFIQKSLMQFFGSGIYNSYYLAPLEDGSYVCVYFDDYLLLRSGGDLPTGYVRYTTTEEKTMLHEMAKDYAVDPVYVLDMYRHGKVIWIVDLLIRLVAALILWLVCMAAADGIKRLVRHKSKG